MANNSNGTLIVVIVAVVALLFILGGCTLSCSKGREGYTRAGLGNQCAGMQRTPVDYAFKSPNGWQRNPHWQVDPSNEHQPLDYGPVDFWKDSRRLAAGELFQQYSNNWQGCGKQLTTIANDETNRFDLTQGGNVHARRVLDNSYNPRFGPEGPSFNELTLSEPSPYFKKIYGGPEFLFRTRLAQ